MDNYTPQKIVDNTISVDVYYTGDYQTFKHYEVNRMQMLSDVSIEDGGTNADGHNYHNDVYLMREKQGLDTVGKFNNKKFAEIFTKTSNETDQEELKQMFKEDEYLATIK